MNGRNLMRLDFVMLLKGIDGLCNQLPNKDYVFNFIEIWNESAEKIVEFIINEKVSLY